MKKILLASVATIALCSASAFAADMPTKGPVYKAEPIFNWTGFYAGVSGGYGSSKADTFQDILLTTTSERLKGYFLGGTLGYNWQFNSNWVFGLEGDWSGANIDVIGPEPILAFPSVGRYKISSFGTLRARLGYASAERTLWYLTGGWGWADVHADEIFPFNENARKTQSGWVLGAGVEHALNNNWSVKLEYLHFDLGHDDFNYPVNFPGLPARIRTDLDIVRLGVNYKFGGDPWGKAPVATTMPTKGPGYREPPINWTGLYAGGSAGYGGGKIDTFDSVTVVSASEKPRGYFAGGQVGYNWQFNNNWVFGVEGDWSGARIDTVGLDPAVAIPNNTHYEISSFATVRARLGYVPANRTLWYVTGGWSQAEVRFAQAFPFSAGNDSKTQSGWVIGAGVEHALTNNWSLKLEYLHLDLGHDDFAFAATFPGFPFRVHPEIDIVRVGVNYKFGDWGKGPVSARY